jgi:hypothetical protein
VNNPVLRNVSWQERARMKQRTFFGFLFDAIQSYLLSFSIFIGLLFASAFLSLFIRPPSK